MKPLKTMSYVYICETTRGIKIGAALDPFRRSKQVFTPVSATKLVRWWHRPQNDALLVEYNALWLVPAMPVYGREWFNVPLETAVLAVERAIALVETGRARPTPAMAKRAALERRERKRLERLEAFKRYDEACHAD
jgi:hypothetical protein